MAGASENGRGSTLAGCPRIKPADKHSIVAGVSGNVQVSTLAGCPRIKPKDAHSTVASLSENGLGVLSGCPLNTAQG